MTIYEPITIAKRIGLFCLASSGSLAHPETIRMGRKWTPPHPTFWAESGRDLAVSKGENGGASNRGGMDDGQAKTIVSSLVSS